MSSSKRSMRCIRLRNIAVCFSTSENSRSEEHTSELQSQPNLVCRLLLEKKIAFSQALPDSEAALTCERNLAYIAGIGVAVDVPVTADFTSRYGQSPQHVADHVTTFFASA